MNPLVLSWLLMNSLVLYKLKKSNYKYLFITSLMLTITTVLHHYDYDKNTPNIDKLDRIMCLIYVFHLMKICYMNPYFWICICLIGYLFFGFIENKQTYKNGWKNLKEITPHFLMHMICCIGILYGIPNKYNIN